MRRARTQSAKAPGFALLEALVAMVIVAAVGTALFALINTGLQSLNKAEAHAQSIGIQPQLLAWVRTIELERLPASHRAEMSLWSGQTQYRAEASLERIHGPVMAVTASGSPGIHQIALYDVTVRIYANNRPLDPLHTRRVASRQVEEEPRQR